MIKKLHLLKSKLFLFVLMVLISSVSFSHNTTISAISVLVEKNVVSLTINKELITNGLAYFLIKSHNSIVVWPINPLKTKDSKGFTIDGLNFGGDAFRVEEATPNLSKAQTIINNFVFQGAVVHVVLTPVTIPLYKELTELPNRFLDADIGSIAKACLLNAGLPNTVYNVSLHATLIDMKGLIGDSDFDLEPCYLVSVDNHMNLNITNDVKISLG